MKRRFPFYSNLIWPPPFAVMSFIFIYGMVCACLWLIELPVRRAGGLTGGESDEIVKMRGGILVCAAGMYAAFRLWRFHPVCNQAYAAWLRLSPWTAAKPLPFGPVHPVLQDAAVIGALSAVCYWHAHTDPTGPLEAFGMVYLIGMTILLAVARRWWHCLALGFLWPALFLPEAAGAPGFCVIGLMIIVVCHGHLQSLKSFRSEVMKHAMRRPADAWQMDIQIPDPVNGPKSAGTQYNVGWPYLVLSPKAQPLSVSNLVNASLSALVGWWSFCLIEATKAGPLPELIVMSALFAAVFRLVTYCSSVTTPFNVWGRLSTGRIIVPGFDKVFVTPLLVVLAAILGGMIIKRSDAWYPEVESGVIAVLWFLLFGGGPTLRNWILTGQFRFKPRRQANNKQQIVRPI